MTIVPFEVRDNKCVTPCPFGKTTFYNEIVLVGTWMCKDCWNIATYDHEKKEVGCLATNETYE